jgi:type II secretory pathway component PulC
MSSGLYTNIAIIYMKIVTVIWTLTSTNVHISISSTFKNTYPSQGSAASTLDWSSFNELTFILLNTKLMP